jgi:hypothetical protein
MLRLLVFVSVARERVDALEAAHFDFAIAPNLKNRVLSSEVRPAG